MFTAYLMPAAALTLAAPAALAQSNAEPVVATAAAASVGASPSAKFCIKEVPTGSRIAKKTCKTRDQWLDVGVDVLARR